jgi:3-methyladenine DNA glycosylase/8-oxoguanine DNA glycosylase
MFACQPAGTTVIRQDVLMPEPTFSAAELPGLCDTVASLDPDLQRVVDEYGYPEFWDRPNTFESLVWFILEQQVSLASAQGTEGPASDDSG